MDRLAPHHLSQLDSPVHRLDPRTKLVLTLAFVGCAVSTPPTRLAAFVGYTGLLLCAIGWARVPVRYVLVRTAAVLPFSLLAAAWLPFLHVGPALELWDGGVRLSVSGLWLLAGVMMKSLLGTAAAILLAVTTPLPALAAGLRKLGAPVIFVDTLTLIYRYLFVLVEEAGRLRRAAAARGYRPRWLGQALLIGRLVGQLFLRSYERAERVYGAMLQRGYRGSMPVSRPLALRTADMIAAFVVLPVLVAVRTWLR